MPDPIATAADFVRLLDLEVRQHLGETNLTLPRYAALSRADGATAAALARHRGVTQQMVSKTISELVLLSYVKRIPADDRRQQLLRVTTLGQHALDQAQALALPAALVAEMAAFVEARA